MGYGVYPQDKGYIRAILPDSQIVCLFSEEETFIDNLFNNIDQCYETVYTLANVSQLNQSFDGNENIKLITILLSQLLSHYYAIELVNGI